MEITGCIFQEGSGRWETVTAAFTSNLFFAPLPDPPPFISWNRDVILEVVQPSCDCEVTGLFVWAGDIKEHCRMFSSPGLPTAASIYGREKMPYLFKLLTDTEYVHLNVSTCNGIRFRGMLSSKAGSLNLNILVMWGRMILCCGGLSCAL